MASLLEMIARTQAEGQQSAPPPIDREAAETRLREAMHRFVRVCPFKLGDWVTPVKDGAYRGAGEPCVVVKVLTGVFHDFEIGELGTPNWGQRRDMRIVNFYNGDILAAWVESSFFEPYVCVSKPD